MPAQRGNFVRAAEWRRAREFAATAAKRAGPEALAITGEAGAGKSSLWRAAVAEAAGEGCRVLRSEPSASEADAPFAGLSDLLAGVVSLAASGIPAPQREALEVALLARPAGEQPPPAYAIGRGVLAALNVLLTAGPVLLAVDDVQWLDSGSMEALVFALRRAGGGLPTVSANRQPTLSLLIAARTEAPADPLTVGTPSPPDGWRALLTAFPAAEELTLAPLGVAQVQSLLPETATATQARLVTVQSRGNPFWAREIWTSIATATAPAPTPASGEAPVPPRARAALAGRLRRSLSQAAAEALAVVAAAGRISVPDALAAMDGLADPAAAIDEAVVAGVVVEIGSRLAPAHPLIGATAVEAMPPGQRAALYRRLAALSAGPERRAQFTALAAEAEGTMPDPVVANVLDDAAAAAASKAAYAAAGKFAGQAVKFTPPDAAALIRRRIRAAELLELAGEFGSSLEHLEALDVYTLPTADLELALPRLIGLVSYLHDQSAATGIITRLIETAGDDQRRRALLLALASNPIYGIRRGRRAAAAEAVRCAEAVAPEANLALHTALLNLTVAKAIEGDGLDTGLLDRAEELEPFLEGLSSQDIADCYRGVWSRYLDDLDTSRSALLRCAALSRETADDSGLWAILGYMALTEELAGDYATARTALTDADTVAAQYDWPHYPWLTEPRCELLIADGDLGGALRMVDERLPEEESQPLAVRFMGACLRGKVSWWSGDADAAVRYFERAAGYADEFGWIEPGVRSRIDHLLAEAYVATGQPEQAAVISARLRDLGTRSRRPVLIGDASRIDALAAAAAGDLDTAAQRAREAVAAHEQSPLRPELARSLLILGQVERRRKDRTASRTALRRARDLAASIGHQPLLAQIAPELPASALSRPETMLSAAEQRVAEQIAKGATSREAAAELFLSVRTVETHVASIYRKLGVRTRSELRRALRARTVEAPLSVKD